MKLLQLVEAAATGAGRHVIELTGGLLARGHEVHLIYSDLRFDQTFVDALKHFDKHPRFEAQRVPVQPKPSIRDVFPTYALRKHLRQHGPFDLVHCHSTKAGLIGRAGLVGRTVKRVYTPHMFFTMQPRQTSLTMRAVALLEAGLSRLCDGVVTVSREEYAHALELGIAPAKVCLIPNGVALDQPPLSSSDRDAIRRAWQLAPGDVCIGFVGRLAMQKSPQTLLRSFAELLRRPAARPARLVMIGTGPLESSLHRLAIELDIEPHITWLGACDARPLMGAFDLLALTSASEGHPLVVLEAMARGIPVVATAVGGIADTVQHGVNGFVAPVGGVAEIAAALESLVNDAALRERMGRASFAISREFSVDRMVDQTVALYEQVIAGAYAATASPSLKMAAFR